MAGEATYGVDLGAAMITTPLAPQDWVLVGPVVIPLVFGALLLMIRHQTRLHAAVALTALTATVASASMLLARVIQEGSMVITMGGWLPPFGITFAADALGATLALTGAFAALAGALYAFHDIGGVGRRYGFYPFLLLMVAGVEGAFLTGDIFNLYVWFEVFLISSFGLIVLGSEDRQLDGAVKYSVLNLVATTLFLIGTGYVYGLFGTLNMADITRKAAEMQDTLPLMTVATLYLLAFGMKAAAFPVNFWLPASYHTPRIVVAALFGGLLTKIGVYALLRILVMIFPEQNAGLSGVVGWMAILTMFVGVFGALAQSDVRRVLGFIVISGIGVMLAGIALGGATGLSGAVVYAVHSMIVMTALYLAAGLMRQHGGSYSLHELGGLYRQAPLLAGAMLLLILAVAGLPPGSGLWPKVMLVRAALDGGAGLLALAILASGLLTTIALGRVFALAFWRPAERPVETTDVMSAGMRPAYLAVLALAVPTVILGLYPDPLIRLGDMAAAGLMDSGRYVDAVFPPAPAVEGGVE